MRSVFLSLKLAYFACEVCNLKAVRQLVMKTTGRFLPGLADLECMMYDDYELVYGFDLCFRSYLFYRRSNIYLVYPIWNSAKAFRFI
jgi:hypothetical protein